MYRARKITGIILLLFILLAATVANAKSDYYIIEEGKHVSIPATYVYQKTIFYADKAGAFKNPSDIFIDSDDKIYVSDSGNDRIIKLDINGNFIKGYDNEKNGGLSNPQGIFVDTYGGIYIADTGNSRIVHLSQNGRFVEEFVKPESNLLDENLVFQPEKVNIARKTGFIYVTMGEKLMSIDTGNNFRGYIGQSRVGMTLEKLIQNIFFSRRQKDQLLDEIAASCVNFAMDDRDFIYMVTLDSKGQIKKLNSIGNNMYPHQKYGENTVVAGESVEPYFSDITVDGPAGVITVLDKTGNTIYQYDPDGNMICAFGGKGEYKGGFITPCSLDIDSKGNMYIVDTSLNCIYVYKPTLFINLIHKALGLYYDGKYIEACGIWEEIGTIASGYNMVNTGIAKALYKQGELEESMDKYMQAENREGYTESFSEVRKEFIQKYFLIIAAAILLLVVIFVFLYRKLKKYTSREKEKYYENRAEGKSGLVKMLRLGMCVILSPVETFKLIKYSRKELKYAAPFIILLAMLAVRIIYIYILHFPFVVIAPKDNNIWYEAGKVFIPVITWTYSCYFVTSIYNGETTFKEILTAASYSVIPYIIFIIPLGLLSRFFALNELELYKFLETAVWLWIIILFISSVYAMNSYSVKRTLLICLLSILGMGLILVIILLIIALVSQIYVFISGLLIELMQSIKGT